MARPPWQIQSRGRIDAKPTMAKTGADFIRENGGSMMPPEVSGAFGGLAEFHRNQVTPSAHDRLQAKARAEQGQSGGFSGDGRGMAEIASANEAQRIANNTFAGKPPLTPTMGAEPVGKPDAGFAKIDPSNPNAAFNLTPGPAAAPVEGEMRKALDGSGDNWIWEGGKGVNATERARGGPQNTVDQNADSSQDDGFTAPFVSKNSSPGGNFLIGNIAQGPEAQAGERFAQAAPAVGRRVAQDQFAEQPATPFFQKKGSVNPDFINRRVREFVRTPEGAFAYQDMQNRSESARHSQANEIEKFNAGEANDFAKQEITQRGMRDRAAETTKSQRTLAKEAFDRQQTAKIQEEGRKKVEKDNEKMIKDATEHEGQAGRIKAMSKLGILDADTEKFIANQPPALQKGYLDTIYDHHKANPAEKETKIIDVDGHKFKVGPGTEIKEPPAAKSNFSPVASSKMAKDLKTQIDSDEFDSLPEEEQNKVWDEYKLHYKNSRFKEGGEKKSAIGPSAKEKQSSGVDFLMGQP